MMADQVALALFNISGEQRAWENLRGFSRSKFQNKTISFINRKFVEISNTKREIKSRVLKVSCYLR